MVWDASTGEQLRKFPGAKEDGQIDWPAFRWSHDDALFARLGEDCVYVYESSTMKLIRDKHEKRERALLALTDRYWPLLPLLTATGRD